jgi:hypothetical protein
MAIERDNTAERLARIDKLMAEMKPTPAEKPTTRPERPQRVASQPNISALAHDHCTLRPITASAYFASAARFFRQ